MKITFSVIICLVLFSCGTELPSKESLVTEYYDLRVQALKDRKYNDCLNKAIENAQFDLDSLFESFVNTQVFDSTNFPPKPVRPTAPEHIINQVQKFEIEK